MHLIFCGDTSVPFGVVPRYEDVKHIFAGCRTMLNLEGAILPDTKAVEGFRFSDKYSVYSAPQVIEMLKDLNVEAVSLCNNHILDFNYPIKHTVDALSDAGIRSFGLSNHDILETELNGRRLFVITFATFACEHSLKLFSPDKVVAETSRLRQLNPDALIVIYPHWGREKFNLPDPADRSLARRLVDAGANLIVGHHPHLIQPIEHYKGVPIVYSLGNFFMASAEYAGKLLEFKKPELQSEMILKWDGENIELIPLRFLPQENRLVPSHDVDVQRYFRIIPESISPKDYRRMVAQKSSLMDKLFRTRLFDNDFGERLCYAQRSLFRKVRRLAISLGAHKPK